MDHSVNQDPVIRRVDNFIQRINPYPADEIGVFLILNGQWANFISCIALYLLDKIIHSQVQLSPGLTWTRSMDHSIYVNQVHWPSYRPGPWTTLQTRSVDNSTDQVYGPLYRPGLWTTLQTRSMDHSTDQVYGPLYRPGLRTTLQTRSMDNSIHVNQAHWPSYRPGPWTTLQTRSMDHSTDQVYGQLYTY